MSVRAGKWSLEVEISELPLGARFVIARETWDVAVNVFVRLGFGSAMGIGEGQPDAHWGESPESVAAALEAAPVDALAGPFDLEGVLELLPPGSARSALDIALHDLAARTAGISVAELVGTAGREPPPTSITVPIESPAVMAERAAGLREWPVLKVKVGGEGDVDAVAAVREAYDGTIRIDANEGWGGPAEALDRLDRLAAFDIELCEQPIPTGRRGELAEITSASPIPVFADEDACTASDVVALAGAVHGVNVKLRKAGGIRGALHAIAAARACGLGVMIGCDLETGVAATAAASIAGLADHADVDGPLLLARDPFPGVVYERGRLRLPPGPGLGVGP